MDSITFRVVTHLICWYILLASFLNQDMKAPQFFSFPSFLQYQKKQTIYPWLDLNDHVSTIQDNYNNHLDDNTESDNEPLQRPSLKAMGKWPSKDSFTSTLRKHGCAPKLLLTSKQALNAKHQEGHIVSDTEHESDPAQLGSKKVIIWTFKRLNSLSKL